MVARDHNRLDARLDASADSLLRFRPRRVHHSDQPQKRQIFFIIQGYLPLPIKLLIGKCKDTQAVSGEFQILPLYLISVFLSDSGHPVQ